MKTFKPIVYNEGDFRSFKYIGGTSIREGHFCVFASADQYDMYANPYVAGTTPGSVSAIGTTQLINTKKYFPVYREDADVEGVGATISTNQYCIAFAMKAGNMYEVHKSLAEEGALTNANYTQGAVLTVGANGKFTYKGCATYGTGYVIGQLVATLSNGWARVLVL